MAGIEILECIWRKAQDRSVRPISLLSIGTYRICHH